MMKTMMKMKMKKVLKADNKWQPNQPYLITCLRNQQDLCLLQEKQQISPNLGQKLLNQANFRLNKQK